MDSPICARVSSFTRSRRGFRLTTERISDDGWSLLDSSTRKFALIVRTTSVSGYALIRSDFSSPEDITGSLLLLHLLLRTLSTLSWKAMAGAPPETHPLELPMCIGLWRAGLGSKDKACLQAQQLRCTEKCTFIPCKSLFCTHSWL